MCPCALFLCLCSFLCFSIHACACPRFSRTFPSPFARFMCFSLGFRYPLCIPIIFPYLPALFYDISVAFRACLYFPGLFCAFLCFDGRLFFHAFVFCELISLFLLSFYFMVKLSTFPYYTLIKSTTRQISRHHLPLHNSSLPHEKHIPKEPYILRCSFMDRPSIYP